MDREINKKINRKKGFTLVEALVAISVLSISILGTFTAVQSGLAKSTYAKDQTTAFFLIQEAMESIRNKRDSNSLNSMENIGLGQPAVNWLSGLSEVGGDPCYFGNNCTIDSQSNIFARCSGACPVLKQDSSPTGTGLFSYTGTSDTQFTRAILLEKVLVSNPDEIVAIVTVSWKTYSVSVKQLFLNIRK